MSIDKCTNEDNDKVEVFRYKGENQVFVTVKASQVAKLEYARCPLCKQKVEVYNSSKNRPYWRHTVNKKRNKNEAQTQETLSDFGDSKGGDR